MFGRIVLCATLAGIAAALPLTVAQSLWVTPLILQAETYEQAQASAMAGRPADDPDAVHDADAWKPESRREADKLRLLENGWQRALATAAANSALGIGYALILSGLFLLRAPAGARQGLAWGLAGYAVFFAAPGLGLPPELPGTAAADLAARQYWWLGTAMATAIGLGLLFLQTRWWGRGFGFLLVLAPHLLGAPQPQAAFSLAPEALQAQFRVATLACNGGFWLALGALSAGLFRRLCFQGRADASGHLRRPPRG